MRTTLGGVDAPTTAASLTEDAVQVARTTMIVLDSSGSMAEFDKLASAKDAAKQYLATLPDDVKAGLVTFADEATVAVAPTEDRAAVAAGIDALVAEGATALNDAVVLTVDTLGSEGTRNAVILSDGEDEGSESSAKAARKALRKSGVVLDAVSLGTGEQTAQLAAFAKAGNGSVVTATDAARADGRVRGGCAHGRDPVGRHGHGSRRALRRGRPRWSPRRSSADMPITDTAVAVIDAAVAPSASATAPAYGPIPVAVEEETIFSQSWFLPLVLALMFLALAAIVALLIGALDKKNKQQGRVKRGWRRCRSSGAASGRRAAGRHGPGREHHGPQGRVVRGQGGGRVATPVRSPQKLDEANVTLRPGEWAVVHMLIVILAGLLATLLSGFNILITLRRSPLGSSCRGYTWITARRKRRAEFYAVLPDSLQMLAGSLSAGYSLPQALDNVAREAGGTMGQEVNRALMESRLGLPIEESLEAVAQRMDSQDFHWTVMAIRINRQVGGQSG